MDAFGFPSVPDSSSLNITPQKPSNIAPEKQNFLPVNPNPYNPAPTSTNPGSGQPPSFDTFSKLKTEGEFTKAIQFMIKYQRLILPKI